jgi:glycosyltransferase involved in cell wall biosynthesis
MKILQICPAYYPAISIGGPIFSMLGFTRALTRQGHDVDIMATPMGLNGSEGVHISTKWASIGAKMRIRYHQYWGPDNFTFSPGCMIWLIFNIKHYDAVVMHGVWNFPIIIAAMIARIKRKPYFIVPHGTLYRETVEMKSSKAKKLMLTVAVNRILESATRVLFTTLDEQKKVRQFLSVEVQGTVIPNVVELADFEQLPSRGEFRRQHGIPPETELVIHYGRIARKKGIPYTLRAIKNLIDEGRDVVFVIAGGDSDAYRHEVEGLCRNMGLAEHVLFTGLLERKEGIKALVDADVFALPSLSENFGMSVIEAVYCNLPIVISSNVGLAPDLDFAQAALVIDLEDDAAQLTHAIRSCLEKGSDIGKMVERARTHALARYTMDAVSHQLSQTLSNTH